MMFLHDVMSWFIGISIDFVHFYVLWKSVLVIWIFISMIFGAVGECEAPLYFACMALKTHQGRECGFLCRQHQRTPGTWGSPSLPCRSNKWRNRWTSSCSRRHSISSCRCQQQESDKDRPVSLLLISALMQQLKEECWLVDSSRKQLCFGPWNSFVRWWRRAYTLIFFLSRLLRNLLVLDASKLMKPSLD